MCVGVWICFDWRWCEVTCLFIFSLCLSGSSLKGKHGRDLFVESCFCGFPCPLSRFILVWCDFVFELGMSPVDLSSVLMELLLVLHPHFLILPVDASTRRRVRASNRKRPGRSSLSYPPNSHPSFIFEDCSVETNTSERWQVDGRVGRGPSSADCCFSWQQQSGPEHSSVRED